MEISFLYLVEKRCFYCSNTRKYSEEVTLYRKEGLPTLLLAALLVIPQNCLFTNKMSSRIWLCQASLHFSIASSLLCVNKWVLML